MPMNPAEKAQFDRAKAEVEARKQQLFLEYQQRVAEATAKLAEQGHPQGNEAAQQQSAQQLAAQQEQVRLANELAAQQQEAAAEAVRVADAQRSAKMYATPLESLINRSSNESSTSRTMAQGPLSQLSQLQGFTPAQIQQLSRLKSMGWNDGQIQGLLNGTRGWAGLTDVVNNNVTPQQFQQAFGPIPTTTTQPQPASPTQTVTWDRPIPNDVASAILPAPTTAAPTTPSQSSAQPAANNSLASLYGPRLAQLGWPPELIGQLTNDQITMIAQNGATYANTQALANAQAPNPASGQAGQTSRPLPTTSAPVGTPVQNSQNPLAGLSIKPEILAGLTQLGYSPQQIAYLAGGQGGVAGLDNIVKEGLSPADMQRFGGQVANLATGELKLFLPRFGEILADKNQQFMNANYQSVDPTQNIQKSNMLGALAGKLGEQNTATFGGLTNQLQSLTNNASAPLNALSQQAAQQGTQAASGIQDVINANAGRVDAIGANAAAASNQGISGLTGLLGSSGQQLNDINAQYQQQINGNDPRFAAYRDAQLQQVDFDANKQLQELDQRLSRQGLTGTSMGQRARQEIMDAAARQKSQLSGQVGLQQLQRGDTALGQLTTNQQTGFNQQASGLQNIANMGNTAAQVQAGIQQQGFNQGLGGINALQNSQNATTGILSGLQGQNVSQQSGLLGQQADLAGQFNQLQGNVLNQVGGFNTSGLNMALAGANSANQALDSKLSATSAGLTNLTIPQQLYNATTAAQTSGGIGVGLENSINNLIKLSQTQIQNGQNPGYVPTPGSQGFAEYIR